MSATSLTTGQVASCRTPTIVVQHVSLLAPHLGGDAYSLRSAIVTVFGHCVHRAFEEHLAHRAERRAGFDEQGSVAAFEEALTQAQKKKACSEERRCRREQYQLELAKRKAAR
eukprot:jgi/Tetstr1/422067/TSEL_012927.t1